MIAKVIVILLSPTLSIAMPNYNFGDHFLQRTPTRRLPEKQRTALKLFPPLLTYFYETSLDNTEEVLRSICKLHKNGIIDESDKPCIVDYVKAKCKALLISPQVTRAVLDACQKVVDGKNVNLADPLLTFDINREKKNIGDLVQRMPRILRDLCTGELTSHTWKLMNALYGNKHIVCRAKHGPTDKCAANQLLFEKTIETNIGLLFDRSGLYISPQTTVRTLEFFKNAITRESTKCTDCDFEYPYNENIEKENKDIILKHVPAELAAKCSEEKISIYGKFFIAHVYFMLYPKVSGIVFAAVGGTLEADTIEYSIRKLMSGCGNENVKKYVGALKEELQTKGISFTPPHVHRMKELFLCTRQQYNIPKELSLVILGWLGKAKWKERLC
jgi:hypothetical protein